MTQSITVAIDAMGGDYGPSVTVPAAVKSLEQEARLHLILVGNKAVIEQHLPQLNSDLKHRLLIHHTEEVVAMHDKPSAVLRTKKNSSMHIAVNLVQSAQADACVSAGNTGALMTIGYFVLKTFPGIDRPAIIGAIPTLTGHCHLLDLGANVDTGSEHLVQFAMMGSIVCAALDNKIHPAVALLNIGEEEMKGNEQVKLAAQLLKEHSFINYVGYVEGDDIYTGIADVIVCDGFVGNITIKASEGLAFMIRKNIEAAFTQHGLAKLLGYLARPILSPIYRRLDPQRLNGATLVGLQGVVIKSHGAANVAGFSRAIQQAVIQVKNKVPQLINQQLEMMVV